NFSFIAKAFSDSTKPKDTKKSSWKFSLLGLELHDIYLTYRDSLIGIAAVTRLRNLKTTFDKFDLDTKAFRVNKIGLSKTLASFVQWKKSPPDTVKSKMPDIDIGLIALNNLSFLYWDKTTGQYFESKIGGLNLKADKVDLPHYFIGLKELNL